MASHGTLALLLSLAVVGIVSAQGGYGKGNDGYFTYVNVPGHKEYEFGWNRGNKHHSISRYEQAKDHRFRTQVKWQDSKGGYGEQTWEYNHGPEKGYGKGHDAGYGGGHDTGYGKGHDVGYGKGSGFDRKDDVGYSGSKYSPTSHSAPSYTPPVYTPPVYTPQR